MVTRDGDALRAFVGVEVPRPVAEGIDAVIRRWAERLPGVRWSRPGDLHVTLAFLGDVSSAEAREVGERLARVAGSLPAFRAIVGKIGGFPSASRARVVWVGLEDPEGAWARSAAAIRAALADLDVSSAPVFVPHVTLGRLARAASLPLPLPEVGAAVEPFAVEACVLFSSSPSRAGRRYDPIARFELGPAP